MVKPKVEEEGAAAAGSETAASIDVKSPPPAAAVGGVKREGDEIIPKDEGTETKKPKAEDREGKDDDDDDNDGFDLDAWAGRIEKLLQEKWKMKDRVVTVVILTEKEMEAAKKERSLEDWIPALAVRGNEKGFELNGTGLCGPDACYGMCGSKGAASFMLKAEGTLNAPANRHGSLYISEWDMYNPDVELMFLWDDIDSMFSTMEKKIGPIPGPWTEDRLVKVLEKISKVIHTEPPDDYASSDEFLHPDKVASLTEIDEWAQRLGTVLEAWSTKDSSSSTKTITLSIARKGWTTAEVVSPSALISSKEPGAITIAHGWEGEYCSKYTTYQQAAKQLLEKADDWRYHKYYGLYAWPDDFFGEKRLDVWNQYAQVGLLEGPWTETRVTEMLKCAWQLIHTKSLESK